MIIVALLRPFCIFLKGYGHQSGDVEYDIDDNI